MRENCTHGSEGGEGRWSFSTPIKDKDLSLSLVGACLQANLCLRKRPLTATIRQQASSYKDKGIWR